ncbi:MAG: hypothetical protein LBJ00_05840 [Planctomycetaceae bacterium]|nr:hypothetical protein [Planctomycetaceae bacterium]
MCDTEAGMVGTTASRCCAFVFSFKNFKVALVEIYTGFGIVQMEKMTWAKQLVRWSYRV